MTILEQAIAAVSVDRTPHRSWGDAQSYLLAPLQTDQHGLTIRRPVFCRLDPHGSPGHSFPRWYFYDGLGARTLIENADHFRQLWPPVSASAKLPGCPR